MLADHVLGTAHADDRLMLATLGALGDELVPLEAEDAPEAARERRRPQPRLAAPGTAGPGQGFLRAHLLAPSPTFAMKNPSVPSRSGRVSVTLQRSGGGPLPRTTPAFSRSEIVQVE
jgi:hypothetical protein